MDVSREKFNMNFVIYDSKYIDNFFRFNILGDINEAFTIEDNCAKLLIKGGTNFTHYYRLGLESYKSSNDFTALFSWDLVTNETTFKVEVTDYYTIIKGNLTPYISVLTFNSIEFIWKY